MKKNICLLWMIAIITAIIFWIMVCVDGEAFFVIGAIISSAIALLGANALMAIEFQKIAEQKGHVGMKYFWYSLFLGIPGFLLVIALPDRKQTTVYTNTEDDELPLL